MKTLTLELSDQVYESIRRQAEAVGTSPAQLTAATLEEIYHGASKRTESRTDVENEAQQGDLEGVRNALTKITGSLCGDFVGERDER